jgi:release factor glutamine methyltransferase
MRTPASASQGRAELLRTIDLAADRLRAAGVASARLDAELLLAWAAGASRADTIAGNIELSRDTLARFEVAIGRRFRREPLAYIVGYKEFHSLEFEVSPAVLIPRPETETLVDAALKFVETAIPARVLEIGAGSGAIAISLAHDCPGLELVATDISADVLEVARRNAQRHHVAARIEFRRADLFEPLDGGEALGRFDLIVSNPPYVEDGAIAALEPEVRDFEPRSALAGGADGLEFYRRIAVRAREHLARGGALMVEVGAGQAPAVSKLFADAGMRRLDVINDLAGVARVVAARS